MKKIAHSLIIIIYFFQPNRNPFCNKSSTAANQVHLCANHLTENSWSSHRVLERLEKEAFTKAELLKTNKQRCIHLSLNGHVSG